jgi:erythromycin esterase-like protein
MNPEEQLEYKRQWAEHMDEQNRKRRANPQEGDVVRDIYGMQVYLNGTWNVVDYTKPAEVQRLREEWAEMAKQKHEAEIKKDFVKKYSKVGLNVSHSVLDEHRGIDIGKSLGAHMHLPKEKETVHILTEAELDNTTLESYNQGRRNFGEELLQLLAAEEEQLKSYGRTELYGIHKAVSVIHKALSEIQQEEVVEQAQN